MMKPWHHYDDILGRELAGDEPPISSRSIEALAANVTGSPWRIDQEHGGLYVPPAFVAGPRIPLHEEHPSLCTVGNVALHAAMYEYQRSGSNSIVIGPAMQKAFSETSLDGVPAAQLRAPHEAFYVALPGNRSFGIWTGEPGEVQLTDEQGRQWSQAGLTNDGGTPISSADLAHATESGEFRMIGLGWAYFEGAYVVWKENHIHINFVTRGGDAEAHEANRELRTEKYKTMGDVTNSWFSAALPVDDEDGSIESLWDGTQPYHSSLGRVAASLEAMAERSTEAGNGLMMRAEQEGTTLDEQRRHVLGAARIILNTVLYMTSAHPDIKTQATFDASLGHRFSEARARANALTGRQGRRAAREAQRLGRKMVASKNLVYIGSTIEKAMAKHRGDSDDREPHSRRGHWHHYRIGPKKDGAGDKIITAARALLLHWVAPTWVGIGEATTTHGREYRMKGNTK